MPPATKPGALRLHSAPPLQGVKCIVYSSFWMHLQLIARDLTHHQIAFVTLKKGEG